MADTELFDEWPERYEAWFSTPIGALVKETERALILELLNLVAGDTVLDAGCGTGIFTMDYLAAGATVIGLDMSTPMLALAALKAKAYPFTAVQGDMVRLPFEDETFDKTVSVTALEFIADGKKAVEELFRVTKPGGLVVVGTLNSLSPWAARRRAKTALGQRHILEEAFFRSPEELAACSPETATVRTVVHFQKADLLENAIKAERLGQSLELNTGAFVAARWVKPT